MGAYIVDDGAPGYLLLLFAGVIIYSLFPMYWMVISGLRAGHALYKPLLLPGPYAMKSYQTIFRLTDFPAYYVNSIVVAYNLADDCCGHSHGLCPGA